MNVNLLFEEGVNFYLEVYNDLLEENKKLETTQKKEIARWNESAKTNKSDRSKLKQGNKWLDLIIKEGNYINDYLLLWNALKGKSVTKCLAIKNEQFII